MLTVSTKELIPDFPFPSLKKEESIEEPMELRDFCGDCLVTENSRTEEDDFLLSSTFPYRHLRPYRYILVYIYSITNSHH